MAKLRGELVVGYSFFTDSDENIDEELWTEIHKAIEDAVVKVVPDARGLFFEHFDNEIGVAK